MVQEPTPNLDSTIEQLSGLNPGFLPRDLFYQISRLAVLTSAEVIPLRKKGEKIEVLLIRRENDDPFWPNKLHTPGAIIIATDISNNLEESKKRVLEREMGMPNKLDDLVFVGPVLVDTRRGTTVWLLHWLDLTDEPEDTWKNVGEFYDTTSLPQDTIEEQIDIIKLVAGKFKETKNYG